MRPALELIAAVARNGVIGRDGALPWRLPEDLRRFRALTTGHAIIMGRRTFESLPGALPGRQNIVVSRNPDWRGVDALTAGSLDDALGQVDRPSPAYCIGGGELFREALPGADTVCLTEIERAFDGDTTFPPLEPREWRETARQRAEPETAEGFAYAFVTYRRVAPPARA